MRVVSQHIVRGSSKESPLKTERLLQDHETAATFEGCCLQVPFAITRTVLGGACVGFALILVFLQVIDSYASSHHGLATSSSNLYYLWTYGPTIVFVCITALWRQTNHRMKEIQPWATLQYESVGAEQSLHLNYFAYPVYEALYRSLRYRHFLVFVTIMGYLLLKAATVLSTNLLRLENVTIDSMPAQVLVRGGFNASNFHNGDYMDSQPLWNVWSHWQYQSSLPRGSSNRYAFQYFDIDDVPSKYSSLVHGTVDLFVPDLICEIAEYSYSNSTIGSAHADGCYYEQNITVRSETCTVEHLSGRTTCHGEPSHSPVHFLYLSPGNCTNEPDESKPYRLVLVHAISDHGAVVDATALICESYYHIEPAMLTFNLSTMNDDSSIITRNLSSTPRHLPELSDTGLGQAIGSKLMRHVESGYDESILNRFSSDSLWADPFFNLTLIRDKLDVSDLMDPQMLYDTSRKTFWSLASQVARAYIYDDNMLTNIQTSLSLVEPRLILREVPLRIIQGLLVVMILISASLWWFTPRKVWPKSLNTIAGLMTVFARSSEAFSALRCASMADSKSVTALLDDHKYTAIFHKGDSQFRICRSSCKTDGKDLHSPLSPGDLILPLHKWWRPLAFTWWFICLALTSTLLCVVALEVSLRISRSQDGIATVTLHGVQSYVWTYLPVLILITIATMYHSLDFEIESLQPYRVLARGRATAENSIFDNPLSQSNLAALYHAISKGQLGVFTTTLSVILAPLLTIVVAGLLTTEELDFRQPIQLERETVFDFSLAGPGGITVGGSGSLILDEPDANHLVDVAGGQMDGVVPTILFQNNVTYPKWTWRDLVFPHVHVQESILDLFDAESTIQMTFPALRGNMNCTLVSMDDLTISTVDHQTNINFTTGVTDSINEDQPCVYVYTGLRDVIQEEYYMGQLDFLSLYYESNGTGSLGQCNNMLAGVYAHYTGGRVDHAVGLMCTPFTELVHVNVTLAADTLTLVKGTEPVEIKSEYFSSAGFAPTDTLQSNHSWPNHLDSFFQSLTHGQNGVVLPDLLKPEILLHASTKLYGLYAAYKTNLYYRRPLNETDVKGNPVIPATHVSSRIRLVQSTVSTRLLQAVLLLLFACGSVTYIDLCIDTKWTRQVLPRDPRSIASLAALLIDSKVLELIPDGSEWISNTEMQKQNILGKHLFSMGYDAEDENLEAKTFKIDIDRTLVRGFETTELEPLYGQSLRSTEDRAVPEMIVSVSEHHKVVAIDQQTML